MGKSRLYRMPCAAYIVQRFYIGPVPYGRRMVQPGEGIIPHASMRVLALSPLHLPSNHQQHKTLLCLFAYARRLQALLRFGQLSLLRASLRTVRDCPRFKILPFPKGRPLPP